MVMLLSLVLKALCAHAPYWHPAYQAWRSHANNSLQTRMASSDQYLDAVPADCELVF